VRDYRIPRQAADLDDDELVDAVTERIAEAVPSPFENKVPLLAATPGQRAVYALSWLDVEVNNGGFHQFFFNPSGALAREALGGARLVGLGEHAAIIEEAFSAFPDGEVPEDFDERVSLHEGLSEADSDRIDACDERWYELAERSGDGLYKALAVYIRSHPEDFFRSCGPRQAWRQSSLLHHRYVSKTPGAEAVAVGG
jgi:hypothetical protein